MKKGSAKSNLMPFCCFFFSHSFKFHMFYHDTILNFSTQIGAFTKPLTAARGATPQVSSNRAVPGLAGDVLEGSPTANFCFLCIQYRFCTYIYIYIRTNNYKYMHTFRIFQVYKQTSTSIWDHLSRILCVDILAGRANQAFPYPIKW